MSENEGNTGAAPTAAAAAAKDVETVKMSDGRLVDFAGKRKLLKTSTVSEDGKSVTTVFDFRNAETRKVTLNTTSPLLFKFAGHGVEQKIGDETAGIEDVDDATLAVDELLERLGKGEWTMRVEGKGFAGSSVLAQALVEFTGKTADQIRELMKGLSQAEKMGLRADPEIKPIIDKIEAAKAAKAGGSKVDTKAILGKLKSAAVPAAPTAGPTQ